MCSKVDHRRRAKRPRHVSGGEEYCNRSLRARRLRHQRPRGPRPSWKATTRQNSHKGFQKKHLRHNPTHHPDGATTAETCQLLVPVSGKACQTADFKVIHTFGTADPAEAQVSAASSADSASTSVSVSLPQIERETASMSRSVGGSIWTSSK